MKNFVDADLIDLDAIDKLSSLPISEKGYLPNSPGVYFVCMKVPDIKVIYIGQTVSFCKRWMRHHKVTEFSFLSATGVPLTIHLLEMGREQKDMLALEQALITKFKPPLNIAYGGNVLFNVPFALPSISDEVKQEVSMSITRSLKQYTKEPLDKIAECLHIAVEYRKNTKALIQYIELVLGEYYDETKIIEARKNRDRKNRKVIVPDFPKKQKITPNVKEVLDTLLTIDGELGKAFVSLDYLDETTYSHVGIRSLKKIAATSKVSGYSIMNKDELVFQICKSFPDGISDAIRAYDPGDPPEARIGLHGSAY